MKRAFVATSVVAALVAILYVATPPTEGCGCESVEVGAPIAMRGTLAAILLQQIGR